MYKVVSNKVDFPKQEEEVLEFWQDNKTFQKSLSQREGAEEFIFYDGPPFATGLPHFGHFIPSTIKDIIPRYKTMKGFKVPRRFGWDCHGLPVENLIEKELGINSKHEIEALGVDTFNKKCRESVLRYTKEWERIITRMGRWVDFQDDYKTMNPSYMESIWAIFKRLWEKGLVYNGRYVLPYCPRCSTVLSTHELSLGYKEKQDPAVTLRFLIIGVPEEFSDKTLTNGKTYFLAWTTTPWTLPSNLGLCLGPQIEYAKIQDCSTGDYYILATERISSYYKNETEYKVIYKMTGDKFLGVTYKPLFPYFENKKKEGAFTVFNASYVTTTDGTGIVHIAPAFGEEDAKVFKGSGIEAVEPIDAECKFTKEVADYEGRFVKDCDKDIIVRLKKEGTLVRHETVMHQYPHCWRCSSPLIYRGIGSWFVKVEDYHDRLLKANSKIKWTPAHIKEGRFGKWLSGARDWAISRNRYWGNPLPIWKCDRIECNNTECIGSIQELQEKSGQEITDLHKEIVDKVTYPCPICHKGVMRRIPEVFDCWFESGSMPYAQNHYPFENKTYFESHFPADFISEGLDQTRGWFYTLTVLAAHLFDSPAFKNCIVSGLVLASDGRKMSKSLKNYTDPEEAISKFGADAIRLFLVHSPVTQAADLRYSDEGVREVIKNIILPLWNSYVFFVTYANIDKVQVDNCPFEDKNKENEADSKENEGENKTLPTNPLDKWLLSITQKLVKDVDLSLSDYNLSGAIDPIVQFIGQMNNWYIRRCRRRFWRGEKDKDKIDAYNTLYYALKTFCLVACPVIPFITESIYQNLKTSEDKESVHLNNYPEYRQNLRDARIEERMESVQKALNLGRSLRNTFNIKVRQPLLKASIATKNETERQDLLAMIETIKEELNVKEVEILSDESSFVSYKVKANFKVLGAALGKNMKEAAEKIASLTSSEIKKIVEGEEFTITVANKPLVLDSNNVIVQRIEKEDFKVQNADTITVALDVKLTPSLINEGIARDIVHSVQNLRRSLSFNLTDRINLNVAASPNIAEAVTSNIDYIKSETLTTTLNLTAIDATGRAKTGENNAKPSDEGSANIGIEGLQTLTLDSGECYVRIEKVKSYE